MVVGADWPSSYWGIVVPRRALSARGARVDTHGFEPAVLRSACVPQCCLFSASLWYDSGAVERVQIHHERWSCSSSFSRLQTRIYNKGSLRSSSFSRLQTRIYGSSGNWIGRRQEICRISRIRLSPRALWQIIICVLRFTGCRQNTSEPEKGPGHRLCRQPTGDKRLCPDT